MNDLTKAAAAQPLVLTVTGAAAALGCHIETVRRMVRAGRLPHMRLNGQPNGPIRISVKMLEAFIARETRKQFENQTGQGLIAQSHPIPISGGDSHCGTWLPEREM